MSSSCTPPRGGASATATSGDSRASCSRAAHSRGGGPGGRGGLPAYWRALRLVLLARAVGTCARARSATSQIQILNAAVTAVRVASVHIKRSEVSLKVSGLNEPERATPPCRLRSCDHDTDIRCALDHPVKNSYSGKHPVCTCCAEPPRRDEPEIRAPRRSLSLALSSFSLSLPVSVRASP